MASKLGNGHLAGMLGVKVLKDNVKGTVVRLLVSG